MKKEFPNIFFESSSYEIFHEEKQYPEASNLIFKVINKEGDEINILFKNTLRFEFNALSIVENIYKIEDDVFLKEFLKHNFINIPIEHNFKVYAVIGFDSLEILKVAAQDCYAI